MIESQFDEREYRTSIFWQIMPIDSSFSHSSLPKTKRDVLIRYKNRMNIIETDIFRLIKDDRLAQGSISIHSSLVRFFPIKIVLTMIMRYDSFNRVFFRNSLFLGQKTKVNQSCAMYKKTDFLSVNFTSYIFFLFSYRSIKTLIMYQYPNFAPPRSFPELLNQYAQPAVSYIYSQGKPSLIIRRKTTKTIDLRHLGLNPVVLTPFDPISSDYRPDRVRLIVCPRRGTVMQVPVVG